MEVQAMGASRNFEAELDDLKEQMQELRQISG